MLSFPCRDKQKKTNKVPTNVTTAAWDFIFRTAAETFVLNRYRVKAKLFEMMQTDKDFTQEDEERLNPTHQVPFTLDICLLSSDEH